MTLCLCRVALLGWGSCSRARGVFTDQTTAVGSLCFMLVPGLSCQALCSIRFLSVKHTLSDAQPARPNPHNSERKVTRSAYDILQVSRCVFSYRYEACDDGLTSTVTVVFLPEERWRDADQRWCWFAPTISGNNRTGSSDRKYLLLFKSKLYYLDFMYLWDTHYYYMSCREVYFVIKLQLSMIHRCAVYA